MNANVHLRLPGLVVRLGLEHARRVFARARGHSRQCQCDCVKPPNSTIRLALG